MYSYIIEYDICSLIVLVLGSLSYFRKHRFPNLQTHVFTSMVLASMVYIALECVFIFNSSYTAFMSVELSRLCAFILFSMRIMFYVALTLYVLTMIRLKYTYCVKRFIVYCAPALVFEFYLGYCLLSPHFNYISIEQGYLHDGFFPSVYLVYAFYTAICLQLTIKYRNKIKGDHYYLLLTTYTIVIATAFLQFFYPTVPLFGLAITIFLAMMFFTIQTADDMMDTSTETFNYTAMAIFLQDCIESEKPFQIIALDLHDAQRISRLYTVKKAQILEKSVVNFIFSLDRTKKSWVFRMMGYRFAVVTRRSEDHTNMLDKITLRMQDTWDIDGHSVLLETRIFALPDASYVSSTEEILSLLEFSLRSENETNSKQVILDEQRINSIIRSMALEDCIREGIVQNKWFELYFQPIFSVKELRFTRAEVLLRLVHPLMGMISPLEFIPLAERINLAFEIDSLVLRMVSEFIEKYAPSTKLGLNILHVNVSKEEFLTDQAFDDFCSALDKYIKAPSFVQLEVTETLNIPLQSQIIQMEYLKSKGFTFSLDDFGTGSANIQQLLALPFSTVKLDNALLLSPGGILEDTARMLSHIDVDIVMEGVETVKDIERIAPLNVDYIQGLYYARPMPMSKFVEFMTLRLMYAEKPS